MTYALQAALPIQTLAWGSSRAVGLTERGRTVLLGIGAVAAVGLYAMSAPGFMAPSLGVLPLLAVFAAASISAVVGFAFSPICGALLFHLLDAPVEVVRVLLLCSIGHVPGRGVILAAPTPDSRWSLGIGVKS